MPTIWFNRWRNNQGKWSFAVKADQSTRFLFAQAGMNMNCGRINIDAIRKNIGGIAEDKSEHSRFWLILSAADVVLLSILFGLVSVTVAFERSGGFRFVLGSAIGP